MFRNGDEKYHGARVLLPRKILQSWEHVLQLITSKAELITPVKRLCTLDGRVIHAVSEIKDGGKYVALEGSKAFQKVAYCASDERNMAMLRSASNLQESIFLFYVEFGYFVNSGMRLKLLFS